MEAEIGLRECMTDIGCSPETIRRAERLWELGATGELIHCLRSCRCDVLEEIHEKQRKLDMLDWLIREAKNM